MPDVLIRNIDKEVLDRLKARAKHNNRSLQEELKEILEVCSGARKEMAMERIKKIQDKYKKKEILFPDSAEELSKERER